MADSLPPEPHLADLLRSLAPFTPGIAGAVFSMAFGEKLTLKGKAISVGVGLASAAWIAPALIDLTALFFPGLPGSVGSALTFLCGLFGMIFFAGFAQALAKYTKDPLKLVKFQVGGLQIGGEPTPQSSVEGGAS